MVELQNILFDEQAIREKVQELSRRISLDYRGKELVAVCILKGATVFFADLVRCLTIPVTIDFIQAASYGNETASSGQVSITKDLDIDIRGKHVLLVDTIIDTGETLNHLFNILSERGPAGMNAVALLDKKCRRTKHVPMSYLGVEIPDLFVVGYGLDFAEEFRNLPYIAVVKQ